MSNAAPTTPREIDTALADVSGRIYQAEDRLAHIASTVFRLAGAEFYYRGKQRVTDMKIDEAVAKLTARAAYVAEYRASHQIVEADGWVRTDWSEFTGGAPYDADKPAEYLAKYADQLEVISSLDAEFTSLNGLYTGWSRFFLVTSSAGHIHSSTCCSTCRPTTRYGWLPELSGKDEAAAVDELGPTLCTVCFPSAPLDWTTGKKLTAAQAAKKAA